MELREYVEIFRKNLKYFFITVLLVFVVGFGIYAAMPNNYKATLDLNVTRTGREITGAYRYDSFYRLQADERFADTVVRWLGSERVKMDVRDHAKVATDLNLKAKRLSSQMIEVTFVVPAISDAEKVASSVSQFVNNNAKELNKYQKERSWFRVISSDPYVSGNKINFLKLVAVCLSISIFLGFWTVFAVHYFRKK
ncbi:hypothetical protein ACFL2R_00715 [Patescibacteria group bacterium]